MNCGEMVHFYRCGRCGHQGAKPSKAALTCHQGHTWEGDFASPASLLCPVCRHLGFETPTLCPKCGAEVEWEM